MQIKTKHHNEAAAILFPQWLGTLHIILIVAVMFIVYTLTAHSLYLLYFFSLLSNDSMPTNV